MNVIIPDFSDGQASGHAGGMQFVGGLTRQLLVPLGLMLLASPAAAMGPLFGGLGLVHAVGPFIVAVMQAGAVLALLMLVTGFCGSGGRLLAGLYLAALSFAYA